LASECFEIVVEDLPKGEMEIIHLVVNPRTLAVFFYRTKEKACKANDSEVSAWDGKM
jgi:hypothetical protein